MSGLEPQVRRALAQVNPDLAVIDFMSFRPQVDGNFMQNVMLAKLTSLFGLLALALASVGLYGVTAYSVERRTSEIGIRMALGADRLNVVKLVLRCAFVQIGIGLAIGIPASILAGYAMTTQLFGVKPYAPDILLVTTVVLSLAAMVRSGAARSQGSHSGTDSRAADGVNGSTLTGLRRKAGRQERLSLAAQGHFHSTCFKDGGLGWPRPRQHLGRSPS